MTWINEYEVEEVAEKFHDADETPNLHRGAQILLRLMRWTNNNSDGWPYWQKPANAASKLMDLLHAHRRDWAVVDISTQELTKALSPIKAFLTKQGVDHALILDDPPPPPKPEPVVDRAELKELVKTALNSGSGDTEWATLVQIGDMVGLEYNDEEDRYE